METMLPSIQFQPLCCIPIYPLPTEKKKRGEGIDMIGSIWEVLRLYELRNMLYKGIIAAPCSFNKLLPLMAELQGKILDLR